VLVLSEAVLVIVIDLNSIRSVRLGDIIESHRHPSQHRHDPVHRRYATEHEHDGLQPE
jgi:hypothetical protein